MKVYAASIPVYKGVMPLNELLQGDSEMGQTIHRPLHQMDLPIATDHGPVGKYHLSYNPDDKRFYVHNKEGVVVAHFAERRNAVYYARTH